MRDESVKITLITKKIKPRVRSAATTKTYQVRVNLTGETWEKLDKLAEFAEIRTGQKLLEVRVKNWIDAGCPLSEEITKKRTNREHRALVFSVNQREALKEFLLDNDMFVQDLMQNFAEI